MQRLDNYNRNTLYGVFLECKDEIDEGLRNMPKGVTKSKSINYRTFALVIGMYFKICFDLLIKGYSVNLLNKFGTLDVVKTKCIRYNPKTFSFFKDEEGNLIRKKISLNLNYGGYWYFVFWNSPKIYRQFKFKVDKKYKKRYMKMVNDGFDYLDISLKGYGKTASPNYIHHIK